MFNDGLYNLSASMMPSVSSSYSSALLPLSGNINIRRYKERALYNRFITGQAYRSELGQPPDLYLVSPVGSGTFGYNTGSYVYGGQKARAPSWTQNGIGRDWAFVVPAVSASKSEVSDLNAWSPGMVALEVSPVPASASLFLEKQSRFQYIVYKLSSSINNADPYVSQRPPSNVEYGPSSSLRAGTSFDNAGHYFHPVSGTFANCSYYAPAVFEINVPQYGKVRNVRVWLELIHDSRGGPGVIPKNYGNSGGLGDTHTNLRQGLQGLQIALRSPNTQFQFSHPLWNTPTAQQYQKTPDPTLPSKYQVVPEILKNSYLLWAGHAVEQDLGISLDHMTSSLPDNTFVALPSSSAVYSSFPIVDQGYFSDLFFSQGVGFDIDALTGEYVFVYADVYYTGGTNLSVAVTSSATSPLQKSVVTSSAPGITNPYLEINKLNRNRHVAYLDNTYGLCYVKWYPDQATNTGWTRFIQLSSSVWPDSGKQIAVAVDALDRAHICHVTFTGIIPGYARVDPGAILDQSLIVTNVVDPENGVDGTDIAVDTSNNPHISYIHRAGRLLHSYSGSTTGWVNQVVDPFVGVANSPFEPVKTGVACDNQGNIHIAYWRRTDSAQGYASIMYAKSGTVGWNVPTTTPNTGIVSVTGAYINGWFVQPIDTYVDIPGGGGWVTIAIDKYGNPLIAYDDDYDGYSGSGEPRIKLARSGSLGWTVQTVQKWDQSSPPTGSWQPYTEKLRIDSNNLPCIAFIANDLTNGFTDIAMIHQQVPVSASAYAEFDTDIDMRTIFADGSRNVNPRNLSNLYASATDVSPGSSSFPTVRLLTQGDYYSPLSGAVTIFGNDNGFDNLNTITGHGGLILDQFHFLTGANVPWMLDPRVRPGTFGDRSYIQRGGVPPGWLTGLTGTTANTNEFATTGSQIGPNDIQPVYSMMDDIFVEKIVDETPIVSSAPALPSPRQNKIIGFRPGLRGTEMHGIWQLLIGNNANYDGSEGVTGSQRDGFWFRQLRLEFIYDTGQPLTLPYASKARRFTKQNQVPFNNLRRRTEIISGSAEWDIGINYVIVQQPEEYGRTIGITDQTGSSVDNFAVFTRITGTFADSLTGSQMGVFDTFLNNPFRTPYIPLSSGSGIAPSFDPFTADDIATNRFIAQTSIFPKNIVGSSNVLRSTLNRLNYFQTRRDQIMNNVKLGSTFGVGAFPISPSSSIFLKF
jgi:hypothetical protein